MASTYKRLLPHFRRLAGELLVGEVEGEVAVFAGGQSDRLGADDFLAVAIDANGDLVFLPDFSGAEAGRLVDARLARGADVVAGQVHFGVGRNVNRQRGFDFGAGDRGGRSRRVAEREQGRAAGTKGHVAG